MKRFARMRSELEASQSGSGRAQCSVGSIDGEGIRYGLITHALTPTTIAAAPTIVSVQSTTTRFPWESLGKSRSIGPRNAPLREGRRELAADHRDRVEVVVRQVLEHDSSAWLIGPTGPCLLYRSSTSSGLRPKRAPIRRADSDTSRSSRPITHGAISE